MRPAPQAKLKLTVSGKNLTAFVDEYGERCTHLAIPVYFLAEWIAENWWPLLWEPRKSEEVPDDAAFLARHSILAAQHGFVLPRVIFVPTGRTIDISSIVCTARARKISIFSPCLSTEKLRGLKASRLY